MMTSLFIWNKEISKSPIKLMKIVKIGEENLHIFQTAFEFSMRFFRKMCLKKYQRLQKTRALKRALSLENAIFSKTTDGIKLTSQPFQG